MAPPFDPPLRIDPAREIVSLMSAPPIGGKKGVVVIGLDKASLAVQDTLLKTLEDHDSSKFAIHLWVKDLGGIAPTVKSRCFLRWSPSENPEDRIPEYAEEAKDFLVFLSTKKVAEGVGILLKTKASTDEFLKAITYQIAEQGSPLELWQQIRPLFFVNRPTMMEVAVALFGWGVKNG